MSRLGSWTVDVTAKEQSEAPPEALETAEPVGNGPSFGTPTNAQVEAAIEEVMREDFGLIVNARARRTDR